VERAVELDRSMQRHTRGWGWPTGKRGTLMESGPQNLERALALEQKASPG